MAARILARYQSASGAKPLPSRGTIRLRLQSLPGRPSATGSIEIDWSPYRYRETVTSAGLTTIRGLESGKAYFTDEDGVTRVASEPILRELETRSYFWRRAWLFDDRDNSLVSLGPADDATASVVLRSAKGNPLTLRFSRRDGSLAAVSAPRFELAFRSPDAFEDRSDPDKPFLGTIAWTGLPTGEIPHAEVGGGRARFAPEPSPAVWTRVGGALTVPARIGGLDVRLAVDAAADGPLRLSPALAARLPLRFIDDAFGRRVATGATLDVASESFPSLAATIRDGLPGGADAEAGGCLYREAAVEFEPAGRTLTLHDPAGWAPPERYYRVVIDDDGDRPVAILHHGSREIRLAEGSDSRAAALLVAESAAARAGLAGAKTATGMSWGPQDLPPLSMETARGFDPEWGDDGRMGWDALAPFHFFVDMPRRWTYFKPLGDK
ncbi:MAG TPA: hypothetical protein VH854_02540 [Thermoanaerobaculia bacterium]|jgi:hypothetical protein|nr:hypothetical protein [Thermoanaerobaculia bacterium]